MFLQVSTTFCEALDAKKDIQMVFCDISKAFDKVWHQGLLYKLRRVVTIILTVHDYIKNSERF